MMFASGAIANMTPRQTAGAEGPKSVRKVMTGRAIGQAARIRTGWSATMPRRAATLPWLSANETSPNESS